MAEAEAKEVEEYNQLIKDHENDVFKESEYALEALVWAIKNFDRIVWWAMIIET